MQASCWNSKAIMVGLQTRITKWFTNTGSYTNSNLSFGSDVTGFVLVNVLHNIQNSVTYHFRKR